MSEKDDLAALLQEIRACRVCAGHFAHEPRPILRLRPSCRLLIVGQAPGTKVHESGMPWNDASGDRLRDWMGWDRAKFYDEDLVAITPMGFCFPGQDAQGGDLPPRPECAPLWQPRLKPFLPNLGVTLLIGGYAQRYFLQARAAPTVTATVARWREFQPDFFVLPHPSWRTLGWEKRNPWFAADLIPALRERLSDLA